MADVFRLPESWLVFADAAGPVLNIPPSLRWLLATVLGGYLLLMLGISIYAKGKVETEEDFLVAGRRLGVFLAWGSLIATWFGAATMSGSAGAAREEGLRGVILDPFACSATLVLAGLFFAGPLWRMKLLTVGDFYRQTYGQATEVLCSILIIPAYFGWVAAQFKALGIVQEVYFGIPLEWGIVVGFLITLVYTSVGGMWSVTLTDTLQIVIAFAGLICLGYVTFSAFGEGSAVGGVNKMVTELPPDFLTLLPAMSVGGVLVWSGTFCSGFFGCIPGQDLLQRVFSANSARTASLACLISGVTYLMFGLIPVSMGLLSSLTDPILPTEGRDQVLQYMASKYLSPVMAVIFVVSFVSIVMSTACSAVLAPATVLGHNVLSRFAAFRGHGLLIERSCVLMVSLGGLVLAFYGKSIMDLLDLNLSLLLSALFVPLVMGLYGRPRSHWSGILPMVCGLSAFLGRYFWEAVVWPIPAEIAAKGTEYYDWLPEAVRAASGSVLLKHVAWVGAVIPADLYGLGCSFLGYFIGQFIGRANPPLNDTIRQRAFDGRHDVGASATT